MLYKRGNRGNNQSHYRLKFIITIRFIKIITENINKLGLSWAKLKLSWMIQLRWRDAFDNVMTIITIFTVITFRRGGREIDTYVFCYNLNEPNGQDDYYVFKGCNNFGCCLFYIPFALQDTIVTITNMIIMAVMAIIPVMYVRAILFSVQYIFSKQIPTKFNVYFDNSRMARILWYTYPHNRSSGKLRYYNITPLLWEGVPQCGNICKF